VALCEAYMGIEPHFDLWNYFIHAWLRQGSDTETTALGSVDFFVQSGSRIDPYFCLPMFDPPVRWQKVWFFLRNNTDMPLPMVKAVAPSLNPNGGMVWLRDTSTGCNPCEMSSGSCYKVD
jgi:hypothetical protein